MGQLPQLLIYTAVYRSHNPTIDYSIFLRSYKGVAITTLYNDNDRPGRPYCKIPHVFLGGGFKDFLFSPLVGEMVQFD